MRTLYSVLCAFALIAFAPVALAAPCSDPAPGVQSCDYSGDGAPDSIRATQAGVGSVWIFGGQFNFFGVKYTEGMVLVQTANGGMAQVSATCYDAGADGDCDGKWAHVRLFAGSTGQWVHLSFPPGGGSETYSYYCTQGLTGPAQCTTLTP